MLHKLLIPLFIFFVMLLTARCTDDKDDAIKLKKPFIESFSPSSGTSGTIVSIEGSGFELEGEKTLVSFGNEWLEIKNITNNNIEVAIPAGHIGEQLPFRIRHGKPGAEYVESVEKFTVNTPMFGDFYPKIDTTGAMISFPGKDFGQDGSFSGKSIYLVGYDGNRHEMKIESVSDSLMKASISLNYDGKFKIVTDIEGYESVLSDTFTISTRFDFNDTVSLPLSTSDVTRLIVVHVFTRNVDIKFTLGDMEVDGWHTPFDQTLGYKVYKIKIPVGLLPGAYEVKGLVHGVPAVPRNSGIVYLE